MLRVALLSLFLAGMVVCDEGRPVQTVFTIKTGGAIWGTPIFHGGKLFFASYDRNVLAVDAKTGVKIWSATAENSIRGGLSICESMNGVVDATLSGAITLRHTDTGNVIWKHQRKSFTWTFSPVCVDGYTIVPMRNDDLVVLSSQDGSELASFRQSSGVWSAPLVLRNSSRPNELQVIAAVTADASILSAFFSTGETTRFIGKSRWKYDVVPGATHYKQKLHAWIFGSPCLCTWGGVSVVIFGGNDRVVRAVDISSGKEVWSSRIGGKISSAPVAVSAPLDATVTYPVVVTEGGDIVCLGVTGNIRWQKSLQQPVGSIVGPSVAANVVVAGGMRGRVVGIDGATGNLLFKFDIPQCNVRSSPGLRFEGTTLFVAVGCDNGLLQVVKIDNVHVAGAVVAPLLPQAIAKPSVLREINMVLTQDSAQHVVSAAPALTATPILITALLCAASGFVLFWRRNHLRKAKS